MRENLQLQEIPLVSTEKKRGYTASADGTVHLDLPEIIPPAFIQKILQDLRAHYAKDAKEVLCRLVNRKRLPPKVVFQVVDESLEAVISPQVLGELASQGYTSETEETRTYIVSRLRREIEERLIKAEILPDRFSPPKQQSHAVAMKHFQIERNASLYEAIGRMKSKPALRTTLLTLVARTFARRLLPEEFNRLEIFNQLATHFIFWVIEKELGDGHKLVAYFSLFRKLSGDAILQKFQAFQKEEKKDDPQDVGQVEAYFHEIIALFQARGPNLLGRFLDNPGLNDVADALILDNYGIVAKRRNDIRARFKKAGVSLTPEALGAMDSKTIEIPRTKRANELNAIDIERAKRGDISARNRSAVRIFRWGAHLVMQRLHGYVNIFGSREDLPDMVLQVQQAIIGDIARIDPEKGMPTTFLQTRVKRTIQRNARKFSTVIPSIGFIDIASYIRKNPFMTDEDIRAEMERSNNGKKHSLIRSIEFIRSVREEMLTIKPIYLDAPVSTFDGANGPTRMDFLEDPKIPGEDTMLNDGQRKIRMLVSQALRSLTPVDREILSIGVDGNSPTLKAQGGEMGGLTRERVRQILTALLDGLNGRPSQYKLCPEEHVFLHDRDAFAGWCKARQLSANQISALEFRFGLRRENHFRTLNWAEVQRRYHIGRSEKEKLCKIIDTLRSEMDALPDAGRFVEFLGPDEYCIRAGLLFQEARDLARELGSFS